MSGEIGFGLRVGFLAGLRRGLALGLGLAGAARLTGILTLTSWLDV